MTDLIEAHDALYKFHAHANSRLLGVKDALHDNVIGAQAYGKASQDAAEALEHVVTMLDDMMRLCREAALADKARAESEANGGTHVPMEVWPIASEPASFDDPAAKFDALLHAVTPAYCVPVHGAFEQIIGHGHRYLVAADGLWLEVRRPWLHLLWPLANIGEPVKPAPGFRTHHATPFGRLNPCVEIAFGKVPQDFIRSFAERGSTSCPNERGAWISWEHGIEGTEPRLVWSEPVDTEGTPGALHYDRPEHTANLSPCIDLHTHGTAPAFFSPTDDQDDAHDVKIAIVIGNLDQPVPTIAARLCCLGVFIPVTVKAEEIFHA